MIDTEKSLQDIVRVAQTGRDLFVELGSRTGEGEVRDAFAYVADVKRRLIENLSAWTPPVSSDSRASATALAVQRLYEDVRQHFRSDAPASVAHALTFAEDRLIRLIERAFEGTRVPALRQLLKSYYSELSICQQAMSRLRTRLAA